MSSVMRFDTWQDSNGNPVASGAGGTFTAPGSVLQVVSTTKTDTFSASVAGNGGTSGPVTGLNVSITPRSTANKILVFATIQIASAGIRAAVNLLRNSTEIAIGDAAGSRDRNSGFAAEIGGYEGQVLTLNYLDTPNTTSATTYSVALVNSLQSATQTLYVNRTETDADAVTVPRLVSTITAMEVAG